MSEQERCPDTPTGEHSWWYQPPGYNHSLFGENRGYWYCNYRDMNGECRAKTFDRPEGWPRGAALQEGR